jgi:hypothetical protein
MNNKFLILALCLFLITLVHVYVGVFFDLPLSANQTFVWIVMTSVWAGLTFLSFVTYAHREL